jgi:predicted ATPase/DNA-binding SARP family transcriptional activator
VSGAERTRIQLCGQLSVELEGQQVVQALRGRQVRLLLAYLVLNRSRAVGREELIGALWPEHAPLSQDGALRTLLSRLRSAVGSDALPGRDELVLYLPEPAWIDYEAGRSELARALVAMEGEDARSAWGLAQVPLNIANRGLLPGSQANWLEAHRRDLDDIRLEALEVIGRAGLRLGGGQLGSVERAARALIEAEPYRESGYTLLMQSQAMRGNVAEAVRVFDQLRILLREELGTTPSAEAIAAHEQLLRGAPAALDARAARPAQGVVELPAELRARGQGPLVGRDRELAELGRLWGLARDDQPAPAESRALRSPRIVVLAGEAGIGKTSLAAELARRAHEDGAVVLAGRAPEEGLAPYQPFLEALSHYFATAPLDDIRAAVREHGPELARLVPELRRRAPELPVATAGQEGERYRLFEAVVGLLSSISQHAPILLVLDDLHWADRPTLLLLRHLARAPRPTRMLVLLAFRAEAATDVLRDALAELRREGLSTQLDIEGLNERETGELVRVRTQERPSSSVARQIHRETEGNPFFVEEIVRNLVAAGLRLGSATASDLQRFELPEGVKQMVARRLERLELRTIEWLRVAAVAGRDFDADLIERLVDLEEEEFLSSLEEALAAGLLLESTPGSSRYSFSHALIREALYEAMSAPRRARLHRRVGEALEASGERSLSALALHFTRAASLEDAEKAVSYAIQAAEEATHVLAHEEAVEHYARALEVLTRFEPVDTPRRLELLLALGETCVRAGERRRARDIFLYAGRLAEELGDTPGLVRAVVGASRRYIQQPGVVDGELIALQEQALERTAGERNLERVRLLARASGTLYFSDQRPRMAPLSQEAAEIAQTLDDPEALATAHGARRAALWDPARLGERLRLSTEMVTAAQQAGDLELQLQAHAWLLVDLLELGDRDGVDAQIAAFTAGSDRLRQPLFRWQGLVWRAMQELLDGSLQRAEEAATEALVAGAPAEDITAPQYYAIQLLAIRREQGRTAELEDMIRGTGSQVPTRRGWRVELAMILCETGRAEEARAEFEALSDELGEVLPDGEWMPIIAALAQVCTLLEDRGRASTLYELLLPYDGANVVRGMGGLCLGPVARLLGRLALVMGRQQTACDHFDSALRSAAGLRAPVLLAHTQLDYAEALQSGARASRLIRDAASTAQELGLPAVARRAAELG